MPRNGSGVYTLPSGNPVVPGTTIDAAWANSTLEDMANEITNSLSRTGAGGMIAPFRIADGNVTAPGLSFLNETSSGFYRAGTGTITWAIQGVPVATFSTTGLSVPAGKTLAAGGNATVGGNLAVTGTISSTGGVFNTTIDSITNKVGADHVHFKVKATQTLVKGDVVKVTGYNVGDAAFEVAKVSSATDVAVGVVYANIANGALGAVVNTGLLENVDTSAFSAGQILYPNASGGLTATKPSSGQYQAIAFVLRSNANNGAILIEASEPLYVQASTNTGNTLVLRDGSGNFSAGMITASLTGNVTGNVSGNAGTVTNGVYTTGSYSDPSWLVSLAGSKVSGNISGNAANVTGTVAIANGGTGATSAAAARTALDVPTRTGGDASGTWGISITGNAANVTGTVAVANGGTGSTTASGARTNLGLAIGTDVPSPTGTGASGTWGISITGNAATVTNGVVTTGSYSDPSWITALAGSKITGNISGNAANVTGTVAVANGGTGATTAANARVNLLPSYTSNALKALRINAAGTDVEWFTVSAGGDVSGPASSTDNALVRFDATTGKIIQNSVGILSDTGDLSGIAALSMSGALTLSGGTANGVAYLNGSKVLTTGSALTFDGTNLGIGVTPAGSFRLEVGGQDGTNIVLRSTGTTAAKFRAYVNSAESGLIGFLNGGGQYFEVAGSEQMRLTSTGLGIGTSNPNYKLHVASTGLSFLISGGGTGTQYQAFNTSGGNYYLGASSSTGGGLLGGASAYSLCLVTESARDIHFGTNNTLRATIDSSGNLGLGVTPSAWHSSHRAIQFQYNTAISSYSSVDGLTLTSNGYASTATTWNYLETYPAAQYQVGNGQHKWYTAPSGTAGNAISFTQAMTLDASGNLGVGTSSPSARLEVADTTSAAATALVQFTGQNGYEMNLQSLTTTNSTVGARYNFAVNSSNGEFSWSNSGGERARIDSSGNLLINTTDVDAGISGNVTKTQFSLRAASEGFRFSATGSSYYNVGNGVSTQYVYWKYAGTTVGSIAITSTATAYNTSSDYRLKRDVAPMIGALAKVAALKPVTYKWNVDGSDGEGFIAHELAEVCPHAVTGEKDAVDEEGNPKYQGIDTSFLVATLVAAIQELNAKVEALTTEIQTLKGN